MKKYTKNVKEIYEKCKGNRLRKLRTEAYISKQKCESFIIKKLVKQFNLKDIEELKEYTLIVGDWKGNNNLKNNKSTFGVGMKRLLKKYVKNLYLIDEYNTSKVSNLNYEMFVKDNEKDKDIDYYLCKEHKLEIKSYNKKTSEQVLINKQMHGILTFKMNKKRIVCNLLNSTEVKPEAKEEVGTVITRLIQRDKNAVLNFKTIVNHYLKFKERPLAFSRATLVRCKLTTCGAEKAPKYRDSKNAGVC